MGIMIDPHPLTAFHLSSAYPISDDDFFMFCQHNEDWRIERERTGKVVIMAPAGGTSSSRNNHISFYLQLWAMNDKTGVVFDSSAGFQLPLGAIRSPDASWVQKSRLAQLSDDEKERFLPLAPDFVIELMSPSDRLVDAQAKMAEYIENGVRLGWLLQPKSKIAWVYTQNNPPIHIPNATQLKGDPILPGFKLSLRPIWKPQF